jgi:hypothetical protein
MSVEKVSDYLERRAKATFRKGYEEVLPLIKDGDSESQLRTVGSVARTENLIGIGTNNRAEGFHFEEKHLSTTEKYEQQAQLTFNEEYMRRADEIDKLRISEAVSQFATGLQEGSTTDFATMVQERKEEKSGISELPPSDSFNIPQYEEEDIEGLEDDTRSDSTLKDPYSVELVKDEVQEVSFLDGFNI